MTEHHEVKENLQIRGYIQSTSLILPDELDDLTALLNALAKQNPSEYAIPPKPLDQADCAACVDIGTRCLDCQQVAIVWNAYMVKAMQAIRRGEVDGTTSLGTTGGPNLLVQGFYLDLFARLGGMLSAPGLAQTLFIMQFALGTVYTPPSFTDTQLGNEIYRAAPEAFYNDSLTTFYATVHLKKGDANPTGNTTATARDATTITLTSPTGFINGGRGQLETVANTYNFTYTLSGSVLTCTDITGGALVGAGAFDPSDLPMAGNTVITLHAEGGCFIGSNATSTPNSGTLMNHKQLEKLKTTDIAVLYDFILTCVSLE